MVGYMGFAFCSNTMPRFHGKKTGSSSVHSDSYGAYLKEIGRRPLLTHEEEISLGRQVRTWLDADNPTPEVVAAGQQAKREMMERNLRLVCAVAKKYTCKGLDVLDLVQEGNLGLARAADLYDPAKGYRFSTYAYWWIRQAMTRSIQNKARIVRLPNHVHETLKAAKRFAANFHGEHHRSPTLVEMAEHLMRSGKLRTQGGRRRDLAESLDVALAKFEELLQSTRSVDSLDKNLLSRGDSDDYSSLGSSMRSAASSDPAEVLAAEQQQQMTKDLLAKLPPNYRRVMAMRYGLDDGQVYTMAQIGEAMGISRQRVRQIQYAAMRILQAHAKTCVGRGAIELLDLPQ